MIRSCSLKPRQIYELAGLKHLISSHFFQFWVGKCNKRPLLMISPAGNSEFRVIFVSSRPQCFPQLCVGKHRGSQGKISLFSLGLVIKCLLIYFSYRENNWAVGKGNYWPNMVSMHTVTIIILESSAMPSDFKIKAIFYTVALFLYCHHLTLWHCLDSVKKIGHFRVVLYVPLF